MAGAETVTDAESLHRETVESIREVDAAIEAIREEEGTSSDDESTSADPHELTAHGQAYDASATAAETAEEDLTEAEERRLA